MDFTALPAGTPIWIVSIVVLLGAYGTFSQYVAKIQGPIGSAARWWESRQVRAVEKKKSLDATIDSLVDQRMGNRFDELTSDMAALKVQMQKLREDLDKERLERREEREDLIHDHAREIEKVRVQDRLKHRYIVQVTRDVHAIEVWAADHGYDLPPPAFQTLQEWIADQDIKSTARNPPGE